MHEMNAENKSQFFPPLKLAHDPRTALSDALKLLITSDPRVKSTFSSTLDTTYREVQRRRASELREGLDAALKENAFIQFAVRRAVQEVEAAAAAEGGDADVSDDAVWKLLGLDEMHDVLSVCVFRFCNCLDVTRFNYNYISHMYMHTSYMSYRRINAT